MVNAGYNCKEDIEYPRGLKMVECD
jgi:hypothetical protein